MSFRSYRLRPSGSLRQKRAAGQGSFRRRATLWRSRRSMKHIPPTTAAALSTETRSTDSHENNDVRTTHGRQPCEQRGIMKQYTFLGGGRARYQDDRAGRRKCIGVPRANYRLDTSARRSGAGTRIAHAAAVVCAFAAVRPCTHPTWVGQPGRGRFVEQALLLIAACIAALLLAWLR